eukprot:9128243-Lingulodinium_polyedra.AAC.1
MERAFFEMRGTATLECVPGRVSEQRWRKSCSESRSETHSIAAVTRISKNARSTHRPPCGGQRVERAFCETRGTARMQC